MFIRLISKSIAKVLFNCTQVLQTSCLASKKSKVAVLHTGFIMTKGELIRSILYPKPVDFKFNYVHLQVHRRPGYITCLGMSVSLKFKIMFKNPVEEIIRRTLDIVTITVPPVLPAALALVLKFVQNRLKHLDIFCISPSTINISGSLDTFVFDKIGTLTEDGLDLMCIVSARSETFDQETTDISSLVSIHEYFVKAMVNCHSLTRINGRLVGDPLDLKMFEFISYGLEEITLTNKYSESKMLVEVFPKATRISNVKCKNGKAKIY
jgi:magnesium-transporting ATPase (P-type)